MLLGHAKVVYEDVRLSFDEFKDKKAAGEFVNGQVPVWIEKGK